MDYYKTGDYRELIKKVEVNKETEACVYVKNEYNGSFERCNRISNYYRFFKTFEEAKDYLKNKTEQSISYSEKKLLETKKELESIMLLYE